MASLVGIQISKRVVDHWQYTGHVTTETLSELTPRIHRGTTYVYIVLQLHDVARMCSTADATSPTSHCVAPHQPMSYADVVSLCYMDLCST